MPQAFAQLSNEEYHKAVEALTTTTPAEIETPLSHVDDLSISDDAVVTSVAVVSRLALFPPSSAPGAANDLQKNIRKQEELLSSVVSWLNGMS